MHKMQEVDINRVYTPEGIAIQRVNTIIQYIDTLEDGEADKAVRIAKELNSEHEPLSGTVVMIPVAAHVEAPHIVHAMSQYAKQRNCDPFTIHLHLNWPNAIEDMQGIYDSFAAVEKARTLFPNLDIRVTSSTHDDFAIGNTKRHMWNGTLLQLLKDNVAVDRALGLNHDIDLKALHPHYISNVQKHYKQIDGEERPLFLPVTSTQTKHAPSDAHPHISKAVFWNDFTIRANKVGFEAGIVIPFCTYALDDGFDANSCTYETLRFMRRSMLQPFMIPGTNLETSIRRYIDKLPHNFFDNIWGDGTFGANDSYRLPDNYLKPDITYRRMHSLIFDSATRFGHNYVPHFLDRRLSDDRIRVFEFGTSQEIETLTLEIIANVRRTERVARFILDRVLKIDRIGPRLSEAKFNEADIRNHIEEFVAELKTVSHR
jgi:hypothetical protein